MCKTILSIILSLTLIPASLFGQSYSSLWKQVADAENKDLPKTQIGVLEKITAKAEQNKDYGQLLKANLKTVQLMKDIAPDSLKPAVKRLEQKEQTADDVVLAAVYDAVLAHIYADQYATLGDDWNAREKEYKRKAMLNPTKLAAAKVDDYEPLVIKAVGKDVFGGDMLSVIGYEVGDYKTMHDYYVKAGMRRAACISALNMIKADKKDEIIRRNELIKKSPYLFSLDSLINVYADTDVAGEVAIERYNYMASCKDVNVEDKISYIHYVLEKWGAWQRAGELRNAEKSLTSAKFGIEINRNVVVPGATQTVQLKDLRNLTSLTMKVYRVAANGDTELDPRQAADYKKLKPLLTLMSEQAQTREFMKQPKYKLFNDSLTIGSLPVGVYMLEFQSEKETDVVRSLYYVTNMYCIMEELPDKKMRYVVVNSTTGQPIKGAKLRLTTEKPYGRYGDMVSISNTGHVEQRLLVTLTCNDKGEAEYKYTGNKPSGVFAYTDDDKACPNVMANTNYSYYDNVSNIESTSVFTDRKIYRPGQTVHAAAIVYVNKEGINNNVVADKNVTAKLTDANYKEIAKKSIVTDKYGTCAVDFTLPTSVLSGTFKVTVNNSATYIRVENYKRPTFQVEFPKINEQYHNGDTLMVKAKALSYAGVPVQGAKVKYKVTRKTAFWWMTNSYYKSTVRSYGNDILATGETVTDTDGAFIVEMPMVLPDNIGNIRMFYNIVVEADVTDVGGETHSGELSVPLGNHRTVFSCDLLDKVLADSLKTITFNLRNAAGVDVNADVRFYIDNADKLMTAKTTVPYSFSSTLTSGKHRLFALCENDTLEQTFVVFGLKDTVPCVETKDWFYLSDTSFPNDGKPVVMQVGSSDSDVHIVYNIISGRNVIENGVIDQSNALTNRKFTYKEEYGNGLLLTFAWVKDGRVYTHDAKIYRPLPDKKLTLKWTTFRDRLVPGQKEEWKLNVLASDGKPAAAQLMATLYDKSLDQLAKHAWLFSPRMRLPMPSMRWKYREWGGIYGDGYQSWKPSQYKAYEFNRFDDSLFPRRDNVFYCMENMSGMVNSEANGTRMLAMRKLSSVQSSANAKGYVARDEAAPKAMSDAAIGSWGTSEETNASTDQMRENLSETAFFYPALEADKDGNVALRFTLPESITTWRFMGMAHTADMCSGMIEAEAVAKKDVMVQPNVPRFVRVGDRTQITAKIFNTGATPAKGNAKMELTDPETDKTVYSATKQFSVDAGNTTVVTFDYNPDASSTLLVCKITAAGKSFSDGEQHYLPVLPDAERVTVTVPFTQNVPGVKAIDIAKLFSVKDKQNKLTIEYTNNPAWLMMQSLPTVGTPRSDNAIDQCAMLYSNAIAAAIIDKSPKVKTTFELWKQEQSKEPSLVSNLAKNEELKDILLNETPWVADADRETEQKQRMADFFDEFTIKNRISSAVNNLMKLQNTDGSWSWWQGMRGSMSMTVSVSEMLTRLNVMTGQQKPTERMLANAMGYMGKQIVKEVNDMKKDEKAGQPQTFPGITTLQYLYICALDGRKQSDDVRSATDYLIGLLKKDIKGQTIYEKALSAIILSKHGEKVKSKEYAKSLKEYTVYTEEKGRYYDTSRAGYSWYDYKIPTEVAAIEAIKAITPDDKQTVEEMQRWLLQEKRTQAWDTPINSVNAIYAFMADNAAVLLSQEQTVLAIDGKKIDTPKATAGMGYVKTAVNQPIGKTLTATKTSTGTSWGAVYAQFMQKTSDIEQSAGGISIKREVIAADGNVSVGSRIKVRITIESTRDLDFVQVVDRKAACMEQVQQLSGYRNGAYCSPKDNATNYYFDRLAKGKHVIETEYYIDRAGSYETGTCTVGCAYAPEYRATAKSQTITVK